MVIRYIVQYLATHPDAKDTVRGIRQWWLPGDLVEWQEEAVQEALDVLVAIGWLTPRQTTPTQTIYGMNKGILAEIEGFLHGLESEGVGPGSEDVFGDGISAT